MSDGSGALPPLHGLTPDDKGSIVIVVAYSWIVVSSIIVVIRFGLAWKQRLRFKLDDATLLLAYIFAIASSVCYHLTANAGLGKHISKLDPHHVNRYYEMYYSADLLGICAMALAKSSVLFLSDRVAPRKPLHYYALLAIIAIWAVFSFFAIAFQCPLPHPWVYTPSTCPSHGNIQYPIIIINILTDAALAVWILPTLWKLLMDKDRRVLVMSLFGARIIVCAVAIGQVVAVAQTIRQRDQTWESFGRALFEISVIHLSLLLSSLPRTNRFLSSLHSGHMATMLTDYELSQPDSQQNSAPKSSIPHPEAAKTGGVSTPSRSGSVNSVPLRLVPSLDTKLSTSISSRKTSSTKNEKKLKRKKGSVDDWRTFVGLTMGSKTDEETSTSSLFNISGIEGVVVGKEINQEVEYIAPKGGQAARYHVAKVERRGSKVS